MPLAEVSDMAPASAAWEKIIDIIPTAQSAGNWVLAGTSAILRDTALIPKYKGNRWHQNEQSGHSL
jgi:hypothetical protein